MDFKFSKGEDKAASEASASPKKSQNALVLLFIVLVGGMSYIYFGTDLLKTDEKPAPVAAPPAKVAKLPLPQREGSAPVIAAKAAEKKKEAAPAPPVAAAPVPSAAKAAAPVPVAKPADASKKTEPAHVAEKPPIPLPAAEKKSLPVIAGKPDEKKVSVAAKKVSSAETNSEAARPPGKKNASAQPATAGQTRNKASEQEDTVAEGPWYVLVGSYSLEEELSVAMGRVRKAGFDPRITTGVRTKNKMNRLLLSEFDDPDAAHAALDKLKQVTSDAFIIDHGGKHAVYAGSYLLTERATAEKMRLSSAGFTVTLKRTEIAIPTQVLSVGPYTTKQGASVAMNTLRKSGLKSSLTRKPTGQ